MRKVRLKFNAANQQQYDLVHSTSKNTAFIGGVGSSKTFGGCLKIATMPAGSRGLVLSPTYGLLRDSVLDTFDRIYTDNGLVAKSNQQYMNYTLTNGTEIMFRSAENPDRILGSNVDWVWQDEAAYQHEKAYANAKKRLRVGVEMHWLTTTPNGFNWVYEYTRKGNVKVLTARTDENPYLSANYLKELREDLTSEYQRQELDAEFIEVGTSVFKSAWIKNISSDDVPEFDRIVCAVDLAISQKNNADYTAFVVMGRKDNNYYVMDIDRGRYSMNEQKRIIHRIYDEYGCDFFIENVQYQDALVQDLRQSTSVPISGVNPGGRDKVSRAINMAARYELGLIHHVGEFMHRKDFERELLSFPAGKNDDMVDAAVYAFNALNVSAGVRGIR